MMTPSAQRSDSNPVYFPNSISGLTYSSVPTKEVLVDFLVLLNELPLDSDLLSSIISLKESSLINLALEKSMRMSSLS